MKDSMSSESSIYEYRHHTDGRVREIDRRKNKFLDQEGSHVNAVAEKIVELGLEIGKKVVFNEKVLIIKSIDEQTGNIIFEESGVPKISVFSPSIEIFKEENIVE